MISGSPSPQATATNAALFAQMSDATFLIDTLTGLLTARPTVFFTDEATLLDTLPFAERHPLSAAELDVFPFDPQRVLQAVRLFLQTAGHPVNLVVDMSWAVEAIHGGSALERWGDIAAQLSDAYDTGLVSLYNRELLIENQMQAALTAHRQFLAPSGIYENPFWLPPELANRASLDEQMAFLLGRAVPDYAGFEFFEKSDRGYARGAQPAWLAQPRRIQATRTAEDPWHIYCFGQLRVYKAGRERVNWNLPGGAPNKTRTLFAYLLQSGEKGAHADRIGELLWPEGKSEDVKRARLHHAVAMLRKTLGGKQTVLRSGEYYRLNAPVGSWTDISSFEQACRRALSLAKQGQDDEALKVYRAGAQLYTGDLFEDIPVEYVHSELEDWCLPRRRWLSEMAQKLYRDMSFVLRSQGQLDEALEHAQQALTLDPASEDTNAEIMRIFHAQGRIEAITRQYRQFISLTETTGDPQDNAAIHRLYRSLMS